MHPDISKENDAAEKFMQMREAYKILHKDVTRNEYDKKTFGEKQASLLRHDRSKKSLDDNDSKDFDSSKYKETGKNFEEEVADLRKSIEDWEHKKYGKNSFFGKNRSKSRQGPSKSNINTNLDTKSYTEWHEWSFEFLSNRPKRPKIEVIKEKNQNPSKGTKNFTQSHYETPMSTQEANEEDWMRMREAEFGENYDDVFENEFENSQSDAINGLMNGGKNFNKKRTKWKSKKGKYSTRDVYNRIGKLKTTNFMNP